MKSLIIGDIDMEKIAVIIPTYNSGLSITALVKRVLRLVKGVEVWIVDDSSPDGTAQVVRRELGKYPTVHLLVRPGKGGRGSAVIAGFREAFQDKKIQLFIEMDADGSHDPRDLTKLISCGKNYDVAIGSRYLAGAQIVGWPRERRLFSRLANFWARLVLGVPISDYTNGYRCFGRHVIETLDLDHVQAKGFAVLSEIIFQVHRKGYRIGQIPTIFVYREEIGSNFNPAEIKEAFLTVARLRLESLGFNRRKKVTK